MPAQERVGKRMQPFADRELLAQRAVDAARQAGAQYADARLTSTITHRYYFDMPGCTDDEHIGVGVRALVNGYWGFAATPSGEIPDVEALARQAVAQAKVNAQSVVPRTVELGRIPPAVGHWSTPVSIDPFTVPIEEKNAFLAYWEQCAKEAKLAIGPYSSLRFLRQDRVIATSEGTHCTQTVYESGGQITVRALQGLDLTIQGIDTVGRGWELFLEAKIPEQIRAMPAQLAAKAELLSHARTATVGRYTIVCDGATMGALLSATLGRAVQIDRALGYEANAGGTSFLDDPFAMLGSFKVGSPMVNVSANRSAPAQLASVKWDDEGVMPQETQLVKNGVLHDFQTTREQAAWLAPYYSKIGKPVQSNGHAAAESALVITMQHTPNLSLEAGASSVGMDDLIANVKDGILIERGSVVQMDAQGRNGLLVCEDDIYPWGRIRKIQNGRVGQVLMGAAIQFNTVDLWKNIVALGGPSTNTIIPISPDPWGGTLWGGLERRPGKGQPAQKTSHSAQAVAATIANQPLIDPMRKA